MREQSRYSLEMTFYLGCGIDLSHMKSYEKRLLCSQSARAEKEVWEHIITRKLQSNYSFDFSEISGTFESPRYVCRTCFSRLSRIGQLQRELRDKVGVAITKVMADSSRLPSRAVIGSKRRSLECDRQAGTPKRHHQGDDTVFLSTTVKSPDVLVINYSMPND